MADIGSTLTQIGELLNHYGIHKQAVTLSGDFGLSVMCPHLYNSDNLPIIGIPPALYAVLGHTPTEADGPVPAGLSWHREAHVVYNGDQVFWLVALSPLNCLQVSARGFNVHLVEHQLAYALARKEMLGRGLAGVDEYYLRLCNAYSNDWGKNTALVTGLAKYLFNKQFTAGDHWSEQELIWSLAFAQGLVDLALLKRYESIDTHPGIRLIG